MTTDFRVVKRDSEHKHGGKCEKRRNGVVEALSL